MLAVIKAVTGAMMDFAPGHVRAPESIMMRIYRDTRFSNDKRPYKQHVAAWWVHDGLAKDLRRWLLSACLRLSRWRLLPVPSCRIRNNCWRFAAISSGTSRGVSKARARARLSASISCGRRAARGERGPADPVAQRISRRASRGGSLPAETVGVRHFARHRRWRQSRNFRKRSRSIFVPPRRWSRS